MSNIGNKETMAKNISFYLEKTGESQKEMAELVGVATSTFNDWVKAKNYPRIDKIEIMAEHWGIMKSDLIEEKLFDDDPGEQAIFEAKLLKDKETMQMIRQYYKLDEKNKRAIRQMVETLSAE